MLSQIPLSELKFDLNNVRKVSTDKIAYQQLEASIASKGLLHNLVVTKNGNGYIVIDGNRRLEALKALANDTFPVPCFVVDSYDRELGLHANMMREAMHPLDECDVIAGIASTGADDYDGIAKRFGQTTKWVMQRLALADLSETAKEQFRQNKFGMAVASALCIGSHEQQDQFLDMYEESTYINANQATHMMTKNKAKTTDLLFDIDSLSEHELSQLNIESDLFSDVSYITNMNHFNSLQYEYISQQKSEYQKVYEDVEVYFDKMDFEIPSLRMFKKIYDVEQTEFNKANAIMVITYDRERFRYNESVFQRYEVEEINDQASDENGEVVEDNITPLNMSNAQEQQVHGYFADFIRREMFQTPMLNFRLCKALVAHRVLHLGFEWANRVGNVIVESKLNSDYKRDEQPDDYTDPNFEKFIDDHKLALDTWRHDNDGTAVHYCLTLEDEVLDKLFVAAVIRTIDKTDIQRDDCKTLFNTDEYANMEWFRPDATWLNKYKVEQIDMLSQEFIGGTFGTNKKEKINKLLEFKDLLAKFNPYGSWPQKSE